MPVGRTYPLVALVILDGWGCAPPGPGNAVSLAETPVFDRLWATCPHTTIEASGEAVGLPPGQMGNSEVGHLTIGSGRVLDQDLMRVNRAIASGALFENEALVSAFRRGANVHLLGLVSHGGVHSHIDHLQALLELARREGKAEQTWIHAFTDGRDVSPTSAVHDLAELPTDRIATVAGRYYAMDRDKRWERTDLALAAITKGTDAEAADPIAAVQASYEAGITDEFIVPIAVRGRPRLEPGDAAIFFNFRPDRGRQLTERLLTGGYDVTTMTRYREDLDCPVAFAEAEVKQVLAEVLAEQRRPPAARRRDREVRARDLLLQRRRGSRSGRARRESSSRPPAMCRATTTSPRCPAPRWRRESRARSATATASWSSTSPTPTWSATPA